MVFRSKGAKTFKLKLDDPAGRAMSLSTGCDDELQAAACEAWVRGLEAQQAAQLATPVVLTLLRTRALPLTVAFAAYRRDLLDPTAGALAALVARVQGVVDREAAEAADPDLDPLVDEWAPRATDPRYVRQVRRLIPAGERFPLSAFRRKRLGEFLDTLTQLRRTEPLPTSPHTRDRYKAALSAFAKWLVEREYLEANPLREISTGRKPTRPIVYLEPGDVKALVEALPEPYRALEALIAGTGMEWGAVAAARRRDVDLDARLVYAKGTKNHYRDRWVEVSEDWAWAIVERHVRALAPNAPLFAVTENAALTEHHAAATTLGLRKTTLHQHRNSYAVMWIRRSHGDAERLQWLKNQLGHAPQSMLIHTRYGVFIKAARLTAAQQARYGKGGQ